MTTTVLELNVSGMICRACEDAIADALLHTRGVVSAQAHYWRGRVTITYDPNIVTEDTLRQVLTNAGYPPGTHGMSGVVVDGICLALVGVLYWGLPKLLALVKVPALADNASLGLVFLVGLLSCTHCIGMCGGFLLAQSSDARGVTGRSKRGLIASAAYNGGRVVSYTAVGALCGALGAVITYTPNIKSMVFTVAGALVLLGLYTALVLISFRIARSSGDLFGMVIVMCVVGMWLFQILENIGMDCGLMPITGIPLPFMSYGSSFMVVNFVMLGMIGSVWSHNATLKQH